jgi:hypothetical protein
VGDEVGVDVADGDEVAVGDEVGDGDEVGVGLGDGDGDGDGEEDAVGVEVPATPYVVPEDGDADGDPDGEADGDPDADAAGDPDTGAEGDEDGGAVGDGSTPSSSAAMIARICVLYASSRGRILDTGTVPFSIRCPNVAIWRHSCSSCACASPLSGRGRVTKSCSAREYVRQFTHW